MNMMGNQNFGQNNAINMIQNNFMNINKINNLNNLNNMNVMNNMNNYESNNLQRQNSGNKNFYQIEFMYLNKNGKDNSKILAQASSEDSIKELIKRFRFKLCNDDIKIEKYLLNKTTELNPESEESLSSKGIDNTSKIEAIEAK